MRQEAISHFYFHVNCLPQSCPPLPAFNSTAKPKRAQEIQAAIGGATSPPPSTLLPALSLSLSLSLSCPQSHYAAVESLTAAGYVSMALTLNLTSPTLHLSLLRLHLAPNTPRSLYCGAKIRTLAPELPSSSTPLPPTAASHLTASASTSRSSSTTRPSHHCRLLRSFLSDLLSPRPFSRHPRLRRPVPAPPTPADTSPWLQSSSDPWGSPRSPCIGATGALGGCKGNFSEHLAVFQRHAVPCRLTGGDLAETMMPTLAEDFTISVD